MIYLRIELNRKDLLKIDKYILLKDMAIIKGVVPPEIYFLKNIIFEFFIFELVGK